MSRDRRKAARAATLALMVGGSGLAPAALNAADTALDARFKQLLQQDFRARGGAGLDRLEQDPVQRICTETRDRPQPAQREALQQEQQALIRWPADGHFLGDWRAGEKVAQDGRGMTWADLPGAATGGGCYGCHQISPQEIAFGTIGPGLLQLGRKRGNSLSMQRYVYGHIYNAKAYNVCSYMPRFGFSHALSEQQIKDLVALLLDPDSPVNRP
ncbi:MAG TPA: sulfur oxidation c-type cytochrome SoxX [Burkholderiaceae bacterium]|nr:sulfur oxidation c-type cytochrome SoxX [Burkholderiaceae bacterium]